MTRGVCFCGPLAFDQSSATIPDGRYCDVSSPGPRTPTLTPATPKTPPPAIVSLDESCLGESSAPFARARRLDVFGVCFMRSTTKPHRSRELFGRDSFKPVVHSGTGLFDHCRVHNQHRPECWADFTL